MVSTSLCMITGPLLCSLHSETSSLLHNHHFVVELVPQVQFTAMWIIRIVGSCLCLTP